MTPTGRTGGAAHRRARRRPAAHGLRAGRAEKAIILTAQGAEQHRSGTDTAQAWINLALALGLPGRPGSGWGTVTGQGNGQGGREHGQKADQLPGYRSLKDPAAQRARRRRLEHRPGRPADARQVRLRAARRPRHRRRRTHPAAAVNVAVSEPDARRVINRLRDLDFLAVSDFFLSETAELADVVLPSAMWAEEDGVTNLEGRVIRRRQALDPPTDVPDDLQLLATLADRLGSRDRFSGDPETVFEELRRASAGVADYAGISYRRIDDEQGVFWPCPDETTRAPGTCSPSVRHPRRPGPLPPRRARRRPRATRRRLPLRALPPAGCSPVPVRHPDPPHRSLQLIAPTPRAELHTRPRPRARQSAGRRRRARHPPRRRPLPRPGHRHDPARRRLRALPLGRRSSANTLTDPALDPTSRMPAFKVCAVAVTRVSGPDERIPAPATQPQSRSNDRPRPPSPRPRPGRGAPA